MSCKFEYSEQQPSRNAAWKSKKWPSHAAVARDLKVGETVIVRETSGTWSGYFREITRTGKDTYSFSRRGQMEY